MSGEKIGGPIIFVLDGKVYKTKGEFDITLGGEVRTEVVNSDGTVDYTVEYTATFLKGALTLVKGLNISAINSAVKATIQGVMVNGQQLILSSATAKGGQSLKSKEGMLDVEFFGVGDVQ